MTDAQKIEALRELVFNLLDVIDAAVDDVPEAHRDEARNDARIIRETVAEVFGEPPRLTVVS